MDYQKVVKQVQKLSTKARKDYTLVRSINNYHLMQDKKFIVIDEPLVIVYTVVTAMIRDKTRIK